jgi:hypothetical protein
MSDFQCSVSKEIWKHQLFPCLLLLAEELPTWDARVKALNDAGVTTFYGKRWSKNNLMKLYKSYRNDNGHYSWVEHGLRIKDLQQVFSDTSSINHQRLAA